MALMLDTNFYIAVVVATIVSFVIGGIWYSRAAFGKAWMAALGKTEADMEAMRKQAPKGFVAGLVANFIAAIILAVFLSYARSPGVGLPAGIAGASSWDSSSGWASFRSRWVPARSSRDAPASLSGLTSATASSRIS